MLSAEPTFYRLEQFVAQANFGGLNVQFEYSDLLWVVAADRHNFVLNSKYQLPEANHGITLYSFLVVKRHLFVHAWEDVRMHEN